MLSGRVARTCSRLVARRIPVVARSVDGARSFSDEPAVNIHFAVWKQDSAVVQKIVLDKGQPVLEERDTQGCTPLLTAISNKSTSMTELLLQQGANPDVRVSALTSPFRPCKPAQHPSLRPL